MDQNAYIDLLREIASLKRQLEELKKPEVGRWKTWTPTVTQSGSVTVTVSFARYITYFNVVHIRARLVVTGTGTAGNAITVGGLPFSASNTTGSIGIIEILDSGVAYYVGSMDLTAATTAAGRTDANNNFIGITPNFALANNDQITFMATYERA